MSECILCALKVDKILKCKECTLECCQKCIQEWYNNNNNCPQCKRIHTFDIECNYISFHNAPTFVATSLLPRSIDGAVELIEHTVVNPFYDQEPSEAESIGSQDHEEGDVSTFVATSLLSRPIDGGIDQDAYMQALSRFQMEQNIAPTVEGGPQKADF